MNERHVKWHRMTPDAIIRELHTDAACGLSRKAARSRLKKYGANLLFQAPGKRFLPSLHALFREPAFLLMLASVVFSFFFSSVSTAVSVLALLLLCVGICFPLLRGWYVHEKQIAFYRIPTVKVLREGKLHSLFAHQIVPGDILLLSAGDVVPCDCRLLRATDLRVLTLMPNEQGNAVFAELPKDAKAQYTSDVQEVAPYFENMLYGASEILFGEALAVAVEVGEYSFLGAMKNFVIPAELLTDARISESAAALKPYLHLYGFLMLGVLFVCSIMGLLFAPAQMGIFDVFLPFCLLCGAASPALLALYFSLISMRCRLACRKTIDKADSAVIKTERGMERLAEVTELLVVGRRGCSDGVMHLTGAAVGGDVLSFKEGTDQRLQQLCEAFLLLHQAQQMLPVLDRTSFGTDDSVLLSELISASSFDVEAMRIRLRLASFVGGAEAETRAVDVRMQDREYRLIFTERARDLDRCVLCEENGRFCALSSQSRARLTSFFEEAERNACRAVAVLRESKETGRTLVGVVSVGEARQESLPEIVEELQRQGVRVRFFLPHDGVSYADACRLSGERASYSPATPHITQAQVDSCQVFLGYPMQELGYLMRYLKQQKRMVAVLGGGEEERLLLRFSPLLIACDDTLYHKKGSPEASPLRDGAEDRSKAASLIRRHADVVVARAHRMSGGLSAVLQALTQCRSAFVRMRLFLSFLLFSQGTRLLLMFLTTCLGAGSFNAPQTLYCSIFAELLALFWILSLSGRQASTRVFERFDGDSVERVFSLRQLLPPIGAVAVVTLYALILMWAGAITREGMLAYLFVSYVLLQICILYASVKEAGMLPRGMELSLPVLVYALPACFLCAFSVPFEAFDRLTGLGDWNAVTVLSLPLLPLLYLSIRFFAAFFIGQPNKRG